MLSSVRVFYSGRESSSPAVATSRVSLQSRSCTSEVRPEDCGELQQLGNDVPERAHLDRAEMRIGHPPLAVEHQRVR